MLSLPGRLRAIDPSPLAGRSWYAALVLGVAVTLTSVGTVVLARAIAQTDAERFDTAVAGAEERISRRLDTYVAMLRGAAALFHSAGIVDRQVFAAYVGHLDLRRRYPGIQGIGWAAPVPAGDQIGVKVWLEHQGFAGAGIWPERPADADAGERIAVLLLEPLDDANRMAIGFDLAGDPPQAMAMGQARLSGEATASGPVRTAHDSTLLPSLGFSVFQPIFDRTQPRPFRGFVFAPFRCEQLFGSIFGGGEPALVSIRISDAATPAPAGTLYDNRPGPAAAARFSTTREIAVCGRNWRIDYASSAAFEEQSSRSLVPYFSGAGVILGFGLYMLARSQTRSVMANAELYRASAAARREAEINLDITRRLASDLDPQSIAQAVTEAGLELTGGAMGAFVASEDGELRVRAVAGDAGLGPEDFPLVRAASLLRPALASKSVIRLSDQRATEPGDGGMDGLLISCLAVPVLSRSGAVLGALFYAHPQVARFSANHERLLVGLAAQAAIALDNARLFVAEREARFIAARRAEDLVQANAELQQFIYVSSHDIQEPLRTITQYLDLLTRRHGDRLDDQGRRYIAYASDSAARMYILLNDLLTYSRLGREAERVPTPLADVVQEVLGDLRAVVREARAEIEVGDLPVVRVERAKIRSVLQNLIGNAIKFRGEAPPRIRIGAIQLDASEWRISIADNGIGIAPEHRDRVFELFERLHSRDQFPGTGIGLAICRKIIEQHGGRIWVEETPGGGSTFSFTLREDGTGMQPAVAS